MGGWRTHRPTPLAIYTRHFAYMQQLQFCGTAIATAAANQAAAHTSRVSAETGLRIMAGSLPPADFQF